MSVAIPGQKPNLFGFHKLNGRGQENAKLIAAMFENLLGTLTEAGGCQPDSREFALARTHLEMACFFAKKSMAQRPEMQEAP